MRFSSGPGVVDALGVRSEDGVADVDATRFVARNHAQALFCRPRATQRSIADPNRRSRREDGATGRAS
jgi:hypothetical protein